MCKATLGLGLCIRCQNVDLWMTSSKYCSKVQPGDVCRNMTIRMDDQSAAYVRDQLPKGHCRACRVALTGDPGNGPRTSLRGQPVEPIIEYYVLTRNKKAADAVPGPKPSRPRVAAPRARHDKRSDGIVEHRFHSVFFLPHGGVPIPLHGHSAMSLYGHPHMAGCLFPGLYFPGASFHHDHHGAGCHHDDPDLGCHHDSHRPRYHDDHLGPSFRSSPKKPGYPPKSPKRR
ncbi:hypothetical protein NHJ13051_008500 [Beauveria bassiana]